MKRWLGMAAALVLVGGAAVTWMVGGEDVVVTRPVPIAMASPFRYPIDLWDRRVEGETVLMVHVDETGAVDTAYVLVSSTRAAFDSAALAGSAELRFEPARRGEAPIRMWVRLPVRFNMPADSLNGGA